MLRTITAVCLASLFVAVPSLGAAQNVDSSGNSARHSPLTVPLNGTVNGQPFSGTATVVGFVDNAAGGTDAVFLVNGAYGATTVTNAVGHGTVLGGDPSCNILTLNIGPIHLDLLGLVIDTNQINLTITAQQGPSNLLGNLLCAVANLLNNNSLGNTLTTLLNNVLGILGGLGV